MPNGAPNAWKLPDHDKTGAYEVTPADIERTTAAFLKKFKRDLETIERAYNINGFVEFGLLIWFS